MDPSVLLYYITQSSGVADRVPWLLKKIQQAAAAGIDFIQIRERDLSGHALYDLTRAALERVHRIPGCRTRILVNDRADIALAAGADGVHLPSSGMAVARLRRVVPATFLVARSCHQAEEVRQAAREGASFCVLGPVFFTPSKAGMGDPVGLAALDAIRGVEIPVLALGGVDLGHAGACLQHGAAGIAAIRLFQDASPGTVVPRLRRLAP